MDTQELTDKALDYMIPALEALAAENSQRLSDWEKNQFIPSIADQWKRARKMSLKQREILGRIWDKT